MMICSNREEWLNLVARGMRPMFSDLGSPLPDKVRIAIGFTSKGRKGRSIGECWDTTCSVDSHFEIFIRPDLSVSIDLMPIEVAAILAHELVHAAIGIRAGHGPEFRRVAKGLGLQGKMTATVAGPGFNDAIAPILAAVGPLPHARLNTGRIISSVDPDSSDEDGHQPGSGPGNSPSAKRKTRTSRGQPGTDDQNDPLTTAPKRQSSRHLKCQCLTCGYTARTSRKWLDLYGPPHCPLHGQMRFIDDGTTPDQDE